jgi:hypothetical protein
VACRRRKDAIRNPGLFAVKRPSAAVSIAAAVVLALGITAAYKQANKFWTPYLTCAAAGDAESKVRQEFLGDAPAEARYGKLFRYFAAGFLHHLSPGFSRANYCGAGSVNKLAINGLEGFARTAPLLAAWLHSGREPLFLDPVDGTRIDLVGVLKTGILHGVDPNSPDYWGAIADHDQRLVEAADIARILWLTRASIWDQLNQDERLKITRWLLPATRAVTPQDNWILFPIVIDLALTQLHAPLTDETLMARAHRDFDRYKRFYLESGWFLDGPVRVDFYNVWGITYDLFWIAQLDPSFDADFIAGGLRDSAILTAHLISPRGVPIMGRSVCYRTAVPVPLLAEGLASPTSGQPGLDLRALDAVWRYFIGHEVLQDGALTQGYFATDLRFLDAYSGGGSCQWGLRSLVLAFMHGPDDKFWGGPPAQLPVEAADFQLDYPKLGWKITGEQRSGDITIEIPKNDAASDPPTPYTWGDRLFEVIARRPFRPGNYETKYDRRFYSSSQPFPLVD